MKLTRRSLLKAVGALVAIGAPLLLKSPAMPIWRPSNDTLGSGLDADPVDDARTVISRIDVSIDTSLSGVIERFDVLTEKIKRRQPLQGYAQGGWVRRPSLLVDASEFVPYARMGEGGRPERISPV